MVQIKLLKLQASHIEKVRQWRISEEVTKYMYSDPNITPKEQRQWFENVENDKTIKYWIINVDSVDVGLISLYEIDYQNRRCFWAYYIADPSARGKGVGRAMELNIQKLVFTVMNFHKLCCEVLAFNKIVVDIHKKYGSKIEGVFREHIFKRGEYHDVIRMGILKSEWEATILPDFEILPIEIEN